MLSHFTDAMRRNPYPVYDQMRAVSPLVHDSESGLWMIFDYDGVKRVLGDLDNFSTQMGPEWLTFIDPPRHTKLRALVSQAFTPRQARDDLLTRLVQAEVDGARLSPEEVLGFFQLLLLAGSETTTNLINNAILCFMEHPEQLALLRARPRLLPLAIEEVLRFRSPVQSIYRLARHDVEMHGQSIPAGSLVLTVIGAANRDPRQFRDADRFDISRDPNPHLAFGHGVHFCLGAALGRLEARIALSHFLARFDDFALASDEPWTPRMGLHVHGPTRLPIRVAPAPRGALAAV